jgi:origin recognition complex subunit 1
VDIAEVESQSQLPETPSKRGRSQATSVVGKVTTQLLDSVLREFLRHPVQMTLRYLPFTAKLFLAALVQRSRRAAGKSEVTFGDVIEEATRICLSSVNNAETKIVMKGVTTPRGLESAGVELELCKVIDWEEHGGRRGGRVGLQISEDDLNMAFQKDSGWKELFK